MGGLIVINYCHNCLHHKPLVDSVHCEWCIKFFYIEGRMPRPSDTIGPTWAEVAVDIFERHYESLR